MSGGFEVDYALLERTAADLDDVRSRLRDATSRVQATVDGTGNPWGDDAQGSAFAQGYAAALQHVLEVMTTHEDQLDYAAASLRMTGEDHRAGDEAIRDGFDALDPGDPGPGAQGGQR